MPAVNGLDLFEALADESAHPVPVVVFVTHRFYTILGFT